MKKPVLFALFLVLLFVQAVPALAMGQGSNEGVSIVIQAPEEAYVNETILVNISLSAEKTGKEQYRIQFPRVSVASVSPLSEGLILVEGSDSIEYVLEAKIKKNEPIDLVFEVTLTDYAGNMPLVFVSGSEFVLAGEFIYVMSLPELQYLLQAPTEPMVFGGRPYSVVLTVVNASGVDLPFEVQFEVFMSATDRNVTPVPNCGSVYDADVNTFSLVEKWGGIVPAGQSCGLLIGLASGMNLGAQDVVIFTNLLSSEEIGRVTLSFVKGEESSYGEVGFRPQQGDSIESGEMIALDIYLYSPIPTQFTIKSVVSNCNIQGLPVGAISRPNLSFVQFRYYVTVTEQVSQAKNCIVIFNYKVAYDTLTLYSARGTFVLNP